MSLQTQIFSENTQNGFWCQTHPLVKVFLLTARVSCDSSVYNIYHIFCVNRTGLTSLWTITNVTCLFEKFFDVANMSSFSSICIVSVLCPSSGKLTIVTSRPNCPLHHSYHYCCWQLTNIRMVCGEWYLCSSPLLPLVINTKFLIT